MDKINLDNVDNYIKLLKYEEAYSLELLTLIAEEVFDRLCEACCTTTFPQIAYRHIEKLIAYKFILNDISVGELAGIKNLESPVYSVKKTSIENTTVEMSSQSVQEITWGKYKDNLNNLYNDSYTDFVNRYRCLVW